MNRDEWLVSPLLRIPNREIDPNSDISRISLQSAIACFWYT